MKFVTRNLGWPQQDYYHLCKKHETYNKDCSECRWDRDRRLDISLHGMGMTT